MNTQSKSIRCTSLVTAILSIASFAVAQTVEKKTLTLQGAEQVIAAAKAEAQDVAGTRRSDRRRR